MSYKDFGLVNTKQMFADAHTGGYAVPAFNFYNMETLLGILAAAQKTNFPIILGVSESAMKYMGDDILMGMINAKYKTPTALNLDHGASFEICKHAIDLGFSSVMIDASHLPLDENIELTRRVTSYAKKFDVSVEGELGILAGIEDDISHDKNSYTNPDDVVRFVTETGCDSLAIAIGTSHGAYKRHNNTEELRFDILAEIARRLPGFPLVLHGASAIPSDLIATINQFGGTIKNACGIPIEQIRRAVTMNICKINIDSDIRLAFTAAVREYLVKNPDNFDPRKYLGAAREKITELCISEIENIMGAGK